MEKILITGSGLLANSLSNKFPNSECFFTYRKNQLSIKNSIFLDITNKNELEKNILAINPDIIIHTAAITDLDWSEKKWMDLDDATFKKLFKGSAVKRTKFSGLQRNIKQNSS